jgi:hypothetical protein
MSAASSACDHMRDWALGTPADGTWVSMGVVGDGSYGQPAGLCYSYPVTCKVRGRGCGACPPALLPPGALLCSIATMRTYDVVTHNDSYQAATRQLPGNYHACRILNTHSPRL